MSLDLYTEKSPEIIIAFSLWKVLIVLRNKCTISKLRVDCIALASSRLMWHEPRALESLTTWRPDGDVLLHLTHVHPLAGDRSDT